MFVNYPHMPTGQLPPFRCLNSWLHLQESIIFYWFMIIPIVLF